MPTLTHYRKLAGYTSIRAFAEAAQQAGAHTDYGRDFTVSIATQWIHGYRTDVNPTQLLAMLNITEEQFYEASEESQNAYMAKWREKHPPMTEEQRTQYDADMKAWCNAKWAKMTDAEKAQVHREAIKLGIAQPDRRSPLDRLIDQACGIE